MLTVLVYLNRRDALRIGRTEGAGWYVADSGLDTGTAGNVSRSWRAKGYSVKTAPADRVEVCANA